MSLWASTISQYRHSHADRSRNAPLVVATVAFDEGHTCLLIIIEQVARTLGSSWYVTRRSAARSDAGRGCAVSFQAGRRRHYWHGYHSSIQELASAP